MNDDDGSPNQPVLIDTNRSSGIGGTFTMTHITRRNPEMEKYVEIKPVVMEGFPDAHHVFLRSTNQRFCVSGFDACETMEEAEWLRDMLCVALAHIVAENSAAK